MARPLRLEYPGAWYHVMNRGAGRRAIFKTDQHRRLFLALLGDIFDTYYVQTHAYCLMGNHYHLLLHTPAANLGRALRHLNGVYTQRYNRAQHTDGPLFRGRYKAVLIDADNYLLQVSRYIHRNPVEAGMVKRATDHRWSSYRAYLKRTAAPPWLHTSRVLAVVGQREARARYQAYVEQGIDEELRAFYTQKRMAPILGSGAFRKRLARRRKPAADTKEVPTVRRLRPQPTLKRISRAVASAFGVAERTLYAPAPGRGKGNLPRAVAMALARSPGGYDLKAIAQEFGVAHYSSVSVAISRLRTGMQKDAALEKKVRRLAGTLTRT